MRKNSNIIRAFDALTIVKGINSLGGPDKQVYYIESDVYAPDRRITPLLLQPYVNVSDPNGIITAGDKVSELVDGAWYVDSIDPKNRVTKSSAGSTLDDPFTIDENHLLMVRLNTDKSVMLFFEGDYYDSRKGSKIHISLSYMLSTTHNTQNKPAPKVLLSKGSSYTYNPLYDLTELVIESQLADDGKLLRGAVEWCEVEGTKVTPISDAMPYYMSGQHSDKLKINPSLMGDSLIRARNVSEELYNKAYGINPEWDSRMKEVFDNRNLALKSSRIASTGYWVGNMYLASEWEIGQTYRVSVDPTTIQEGAYILFYTNVGSAPCVTTLRKENNFTNTFLYTKDIPQQPSQNNLATFFQRNKDDTNATAPIVLEKILITKGSEAKTYTPAPEDLNWENLTRYGGRYEMKDSPTNTIALQMPIYPNTNTFRDIQLCFRVENTTNPTDYFTSVVWQGGNPVSNKAYAKYKVGDMVYINLTTNSSYNNNARADFLVYHGEGQRGVSSLISSVFMHFTHLRLPFQLSPYALAPDGILKGTYQSDMKFTPLYPNIEADVVYLTTPVVKKGVERIKAQAVLSTNKKTITNPEKHFDLKWILKPTTAGGSETVVGTGEFVDIPVANLPEGRVIGLDLDYNFKKQ